MRIFPIKWRGPGRLAVVSRPDGDDLAREMRELREAGYDVLVSLLTEPEAAELGLRGEPVAAEAAGLTFEWLPVPDFSLPEGDSFREALFALHDRLCEGGAIAAHCRGSVGRSPLLIASLLVLDGAGYEDAWARVSRARGVAVPDTDEQRRWIERLRPRQRT